MYISDFIKELQRIQDTNGDLLVLTDNDRGPYSPAPEVFTISPTSYPRLRDFLPRERERYSLRDGVKVVYIW